MTWTRGPTIGRGTTATVSIAATASGDIFAVKSTDLACSDLLRKEESLISQLHSPHVITCLGSDVTFEQDKFIYNLFLEYSGGGSLSDLIGKSGGALGEESIRLYSRQLLQGLEYLHREGIVHCDIKGANILTGGGGAWVKIADFGCAKLAGSGEAFAGTPAYMAPEVARGEAQGFAADVWAVGCTVVEMATGRHPWPEMRDPAAALYRIGFSGEEPEVPKWLSGDARDFLERCLVREAERRWTAEELLRHPFLEMCGGEFGEIEGRSPTSVMDIGFWDAVEVSESPKILTATEVAKEKEEDSPMCRIGALIGCGVPRWSDFGEGENWVTVRANQVEECEFTCVDQMIETSKIKDLEFEFKASQPLNLFGLPVSSLSSSSSSKIEELNGDLTEEGEEGGVSYPNLFDFLSGDIECSWQLGEHIEIVNFIDYYSYHHYSELSVVKIILMEVCIDEDKVCILCVSTFHPRFACFAFLFFKNLGFNKKVEKYPAARISIYLTKISKISYKIFSAFHLYV